MAVAPEQAVFWYGCNLTRHGEIIRNATRLLEAVGIAAAPAGGPAHCCGSPKEANARINEGMARRTVEAFNARLAGATDSDVQSTGLRGTGRSDHRAPGRPQVVTWCPSCHMNMHDVMAPVTPTAFSTIHVSEVLFARREALRLLLTKPVPARVLVHGHHGFHGRVPVNDRVPDLLRLIPGLTVVEHPYRAPAHMCSGLTGVPGALADAHRATLAAMAETGADTLCTIFHSCHRDAVGLEQNHTMRVVNWVHLLAEAAGWDAADDYKAMRKAADPRAALGEAGIAAAGEAVFTRLLEPELRRPPVV